MATQEVIYDVGVVESAPDVVELALVGRPNALTLFEPNGLDPILDKIRGEVSRHVPDISTERGRKAIASLARKVASSKVRLDDLGKELVTEVKAQIGAIDAERKRMRDELDKLRDETRQPLTDWENAETSRLQGHEDALSSLASLGNVPFNSSLEEIVNRIEDARSYAKREWQEFKRRYEVGSEAVIASLTKLHAETKRAAEDRRELERLQAEEAKRLQDERDSRLQAEAAEKAKGEAEAKARAAAEAEERRQLEAAAKAKQEADARIKKAEEEAARVKAEAERKVKLQQEEAERVARAKAAEAKRQQDAADSARRDAEERTRKAEEAAAKAAKDAEMAIERERERVAADKRKEAEAAAKREADVKHRAAVNRGAMAALIASVGVLTEADAILIVKAIAKNEIPAVRITY